jgi:hypothetical protein
MTGSKDGLQPRCKCCAAEYYAVNRDRLYPAIRERKQRVVLETARFVWGYLIEHPCVDCSERDPLVLEFDHVRGIKRMAIANMIREGYGLRMVKLEIAKCEVRCANCHRRRTASQLGWHRWLTGDAPEELDASMGDRSGFDSWQPTSSAAGVTESVSGF